MILWTGPSTPAHLASAEPLPAQSIMPPLRGPADSPATLRGFWQLSGEAPIRRRQEPVMRQPFRLLLTGSRTWDDIPSSSTPWP